MIRYGYPFVGVHWIFDFAVRLTDRTFDPLRGVIGGIVKGPEEIAVGVDAMSRLITNSLGLDCFFVALFITQEEPGVREGRQEECIQGKLFFF